MDGTNVEFVAISIGAIVGANARYLVGGWVADRLGPTFPYGTLVINLTGSFLLGLILAVVSQRASAPIWIRTGLAVGLIGSYTTFSTFGVETYTLLNTGSLGQAAINILASVLGSLLAVYLGLQVGRLV
jgi:CrcB protein